MSDIDINLNEGNISSDNTNISKFNIANVIKTEDAESNLINNSTTSIDTDNNCINIDINGIGYIKNKFIELSDTPSSYQDGKFLMSSDSEIVYKSISSDDLNDKDSLLDEIDKEISSSIEEHNSDINAHDSIQEKIYTDIYANRADILNVKTKEENDITNLTSVIENNFNTLNNKIVDTKSDLESNIASLLDKEIADISELNTKVETETTRATNKENDLENNIKDEITRATASENVLENNLNTEIKNRTDSESELSNEISQEASNREDADEVLQEQITANTNNFSNYRTSLNQDIIDNSIKQSVSDEIERATAKEKEIESNLQSETSNRESNDIILQNNINILENKVDTNKTNTDKLISDEVERATTKEESLQDSINSINSKIPEQASATNQLADKSFVNSSISTETSYFVGTFDTLEELQAVENPTNNDYGFVKSTDELGNKVYNRYKYSSSSKEWKFEYALNNSSFTATQWNAINSNITSELTTQITTNKNTIDTHISNKNNPHNVSKSQLGLGNVDNTSDLDKPVSTAMKDALSYKQDNLIPGSHINIENNTISVTGTFGSTVIFRTWEEE